MERRNGRINDIHDMQLYSDTILWGAVIIAISIFAVLLFKIGTRDALESYQEHVDWVTEFNQKPFAERKLISDWVQYEVDETYRLAFEPEPKSFEEYMHTVIPVIILALLIVLPLATLYGYDREKSSCYFYADLPLDTTWGKVLLFMLFPTCWPVLLVSYIRMKCWEAEEAPRVLEQPTAQQASQQDTTNDDDPFIHYEDLSANRTHFAEDSYEQYLTYCRNDNLRRHERQVNDAKRNVKSIERDLSDYGDRIRKSQSELREAKVQLAKIERSEPTSVRDERDIQADWKAISAMRGVTAIYCEKLDKTETYTLHIEVEVRVSYEGEAYDFGDYEITVNPVDGYTCTRTRSGVRKDWEGGYPDYCWRCGNSFCLGDRKYAIRDYFEKHRLRAAIALMIDCLHSVNNETEAAKIPQCFRKIVLPKKEEG